MRTRRDTKPQQLNRTCKDRALPPGGCSLGLLLLLQPSVCWDNSTVRRPPLDTSLQVKLINNLRF